jgi:hypothetical protein
MAQAKSKSRGKANSSGKRPAQAKRSSANGSSSSSKGPRSTARPRSRASARSGPSRSGSSPSRRRSPTSRSSRNSGRDGKGRVDAVRETLSGGASSAKETVTSGAKTTGNALGTAAHKAKGPAVAGGAALAGLAGGLAIATRGRRRRVLGVPVPGSARPLIKITTPRRRTRKGVGRDLMKAAGEVGSAGRQAGEVANEIRLVRQQLDSNRRRSPVEVVLEGLTARRSRS